MIQSKYFHSFLFLYIFILPHTIYTIIGNNFNFIYLISIFIFFILLINDLKFEKLFLELFSVSFFLFFMGLIVMSYKGGLQKYAILFLPFFSYFGYRFVMLRKIDLSWFNYLIPVLYFYFFLIYYSKLPDLFYRPGFDEDSIVFDKASSNGISIALNLTLYSYLIMNYFYNEIKNKRFLLLFSIINLILIVIQQSRSGIIFSFILVLIILWIYYNRYFFVYVVFSILFFIFYSNVIFLYLSNIDLNSQIYFEDNRKVAAFEFISYSLNNNFIFGTPLNTRYDVGGYTFNVFLEIWNNYSFIVFFLFICFLSYRFFLRREFFFPIYFFIPFFIYSFSEAIFFPEYWDVIILILLFAKKRN